MFKRDGRYYFIWSEGQTTSPSYRMAYAQAQSPMGPFTRSAVILQADNAQQIQGTGGGTVLGIPGRDEYYLAYHRFMFGVGDGTHRQTCIDRLTFNSDGSIIPVRPSLNGLQTAVSP
jgi:beta-xylosidase